MKSIFKIILFSLFSIFIFNCKKNLPLEQLSEDTEISSSIKNTDLCGHTVFVNVGGITLENILNGEIVICKTVGAGTVIFKNCRNVDVVVQSKANILLDDKTSLQNLYIKENARVSSLREIENQYRKKSSRRKQESGTRLEILNTEIDNEFQDQNNLSIVEDLNYDGNGVRFFIRNKPRDAVNLNVYKEQNGVVQDIDCVVKNEGDLLRDRFNATAYTYEFLNAGQNYNIIFEYKNPSYEIIATQTVNVTPRKGNEIKIDKDNLKFLFDSETGEIGWKNYPEVLLPSSTEVTYQVSSYDDEGYHYVGYATIPIQQQTLNLYSDFQLDENEIKNNKINFYIFFNYNGYRWALISTDAFDYRR